jgi:hypothetical protein
MSGDEKYKCPNCGARLVWSLNSPNTGASSILTCANGASASRVDWISKSSTICAWKGRVVRKGDGELAFLYLDNEHLISES